MEIKVREATEADFEQVSEVFCSANRYHAGLLPDVYKVTSSAMTESRYDEILSLSGRGLFVAECPPRGIVGVLLVEIKKNPDFPVYRKRRNAYISDMAVIESYRRHGVGHELMKAAKEWAVKNGVSEIELNVWEANTCAIDFYKNLGYKSVSRKMSLKLK